MLSGFLGRRPSNDDAHLLFFWLTVPRAVTASMVFATIVLLWRAGLVDFDPRPVVLILLPLYFAVSGGIAWFAHRGKGTWVLLHVQELLDVITIAIGVALTGGTRSPFMPIFLLAIVGSGMISGAMAVVSTALITAATLLMFSLGAGDPQMALKAAASPTAMTLSVIVFLVSAVLIAFQSRFYMRSIAKKEQEVLRLKDDFLFRTIHDIRSPSTVIRLMFDKYRDAGAAAAYPEFEKDSVHIDNSLLRIQSLVEDLLKIAKGEADQVSLKRERVDLCAVMSELLSATEGAMAKKRVTFDHEVDGTVAASADPEKLREALQNFIDNAVKYNKDGGKVTVTCRKENGRAVTSIADTGIGISEASLPRIFSPFFRGDVGKSIPGTGLGLYYSKKLIEKMGGSVAVSSEPGKGTTFTISLLEAPDRRI